MSAVLKLLDEARQAGIEFRIEHGTVTMEAACPPTSELIERLRSHRAELYQLLSRSDAWRPEDWQAFYDERAAIAEFDSGLSPQDAKSLAVEACISTWLDQNPETSDPGACAHCGLRETSDTIVLPFGPDRSALVWLHARCWSTWFARRKARARTALAQSGIPVFGEAT